MTCTLDLPTPTYVGTAVTITATFRNPGNPRPVDPTTVTLEFGILPDTTTWTYLGTGSIVRSKQGVYTAEILLDSPGTEGVKFTGTGACAAVGVTTFLVTPVPF